MGGTSSLALVMHRHGDLGIHGHFVSAHDIDSGMSNSSHYGHKTGGDRTLLSGDASVLFKYSGERFRARFISRLWMRRIIRAFTGQRLLELGFAILRSRIGQRFASHVFFGRGSFPDLETEFARSGTLAVDL